MGSESVLIKSLRTNSTQNSKHLERFSQILRVLRLSIEKKLKLIIVCLHFLCPWLAFMPVNSHYTLSRQPHLFDRTKHSKWGLTKPLQRSTKISPYWHGIIDLSLKKPSIDSYLATKHWTAQSKSEINWIPMSLSLFTASIVEKTHSCGTSSPSATLKYKLHFSSLNGV